MNSMPTCFIVAPPEPAGRGVQDAIRDTLEYEGFRVVSPLAVAGSANVMGSVTEAITDADVLVVDVTRQNPNIMYELGLAHGLRKPTILIRSTEGREAIPFDLAGWLYLSYDPSNFEPFTNYLSHAVRRFKPESKS